MNTRQKWLLAMALALTLGGCGTTQPSKFYLLNASDSAAQNSRIKPNIGVGPIEFPTYLDRSKIMTRTGTNTLKAAEYHHWAEPLETNFSRVLVQELGIALPSANVHSYPRRNIQPINIQVVLEVLSFDSDDNKQAQLNVRWELLGSDKKPLAAPQQRQYTQAARNGDHEARVKAMSECVSALGQELAQEISRVTAQQK